MFNVSEQAVRAEDNYRRELLRDQNQASGHIRKRAQAVLVAALAVVVAAWGIPSDET